MTENLLEYEQKIFSLIFEFDWNWNRQTLCMYVCIYYNLLSDKTFINEKDKQTLTLRLGVLLTSLPDVFFL